MVAIHLENPPKKDVNLNWEEPTSTFILKEIESKTLKEGELRVKLNYLSNDPTQRTWMAANQKESRQYIAPILKGDIIRSIGLGEVLESRSEKYAKGDVVVGLMGWASEIIVSEAAISAKVDKSLAPELYLSSLGMTGLTAYFGLKNVGQIKEGQTVLISAASGATGSMAVQLAKHLFKASKVIGIAGSAEKVEWVKSLGADYCANYREPDYLKKLDEYIGEDYVDIYFDNVGGEQLDFGLSHVKKYGRIVACGAIAGYNDTSKLIVKAWPEIIMNRLNVQGFIVFDFANEFPQAIGELSAAVKNGLVKASEGATVIDIHGDWKAVPKTWFKLFTDEKPKGKLVTKL